MSCCWLPREAGRCGRPAPGRVTSPQRPHVRSSPLGLGPGPEGRGDRPRGLLQACPALRGPDASPPRGWRPAPPNTGYLTCIRTGWFCLGLVQPGWHDSRGPFSAVSSPRGSEDPPGGQRPPWAAEPCSGVMPFTFLSLFLGGEGIRFGEGTRAKVSLRLSKVASARLRGEFV